MRRLAAGLLLAALATIARPDATTDAAVRALREDGSLKVRTQAAIVLGQLGSAEALPALLEALGADDAPAVRMAAAAALGRIGDLAARPALERAADADGVASVRAAAARALGELAVTFTIHEPSGRAGGAGARAALREGIVRHLRERGYVVVDKGGMILKPSVLRVDVDERGGKTVIAVKASLVAVDGQGRMAAMLESGAKLSAAGAISDGKLAVYADRAMDAAARTLCEDLAAKLPRR